MGKKDKQIFFKSDEDLERIKASGDILGRVHGEIAKVIRAGITTKELDKIAEEFIFDHKAKPSFKNYKVGDYHFPSSLCISVNEVVVHGIPSNRVLKEGDIVSVDCGVYYNEFHADSAYTYTVGEIDPKVAELLRKTKESLFKGIEQAKQGNRVGDIGAAIQKHVEDNKYGVVRELVGHGVGRHLHEAPEVPNYGKRGNGIKLQSGMVLAIEPMIVMGKHAVVQENDNWTIRTEDRQAAAHFEHTVAVKKDGYEILTTFKYLEEALKNNKEVVEVI